MATSADRDQDDKKDEAAEDEESAKGKDTPAGADAGEKTAGASTSPEKAAAKGHDDEEDDDEEDDEEEEKPAAKPVAKRPATKVAAKGTRGPGASRARGGKNGGSLGKSVLLFFVIVIGLGLGFAILGREPQQEAKPKWKVGETVDVEITLVRSDRQDLACASTEEVSGKHCAFEANAKPWSKGDASDDKKLLKPYTTTDRVQFTAAGLWSDPAMAPDKLPASRFSVKCKYQVEGNLKDVGVRWEQSAQWYSNKDWYVGSVSNCKLAP
jgi:hypothetical protein